MQAAFASLSWNIEGKARLYCCSRKILVTRLFSPNKLIDYSPALWSVYVTFSYQQDTYTLLSNRPLTFAPPPYPSSKKPAFLDYRFEVGVQRRTNREDCLHLVLRAYCRIRSISLSLCSGRYSQNMLPHPSALSRFSASSYGVWTNIGTTVYTCCSCLSCLNARSWGSEYVHSRNCTQCRLTRIRHNVLAMESGSKSRLTNFF